MAGTHDRMSKVEDENNAMWEEIKKLAEIMPQNSLSTEDRQSFYTEEAKIRAALG